MNDQASAPDENGARQLVTSAQAIPAIRDPYRQIGPYGGPGSVDDAPDQWVPKLLEYWRIVNRHKWLILSITVAFVALGAIRTLMQTPLYSATVRLQIDRNVAKIVQGDSVTPVEDDADSDFSRTQYELLQSRTMAERVASALKLGNDADFFKPREFSFIQAVRGMFASHSSPGSQGGDRVALERAAAGTILGNRVVRPVSGSRLVDIIYYDPNPSRAQRVANAYADAFLASNLDKRFQANASAKTFLEDKIQQLKLRLEESDKTLLEFAQQQQIVDANDKSSIAENNLAAANAALGNLISERTKNEQLWKQIESSDAINLPQLLSNSVIEGLRGKRKTLALDYQEKLETFKPSYPAMVQIKNQIDEIDRQITAEVQAIRESLKAGYEASLSQETEMKTRINALTQEVLDLQRRSIQYNILKREVDTNRELYTSLLQRYKEVDVASGVGANNVFVVDKAELPGSPSSPNLLPALLKALALGLGLSLGAAYVLERLDDKVRSPEQVEEISGLPILGIIPEVDNVEAELADPRSALCEAYRSLCTSLQFATENGLPRTLVVTSAAPAEGKSSTSLAIAKHFATLGRKVLLVDADLRNASLHVKLDCDNSIGLSNYLTGACAPPAAMQGTRTPNLAFMASGPLPPNAADLLGSTRVHSLLSIGLEVFDLIVIDGPPVQGIADALLLSSAATATLFVVSIGGPRTGVVRGALRRLQLSRGSVIGAVLTKADTKTAYGYGYDYGYGYGSAYGAGASPRGLSISHSGGKPQTQLTDTRESA
jgi:capsular exopolysaccharide synthesis family protein